MYRFLGSTEIEMYNILSYGSFLFVLIYNFSGFKEKKNFLSNISLFFLREINAGDKRKDLWVQNVLTVSEILLISVFQYYPLTILNIKFGALMSTGANYFGLIYFIPIILFLFFFCISINPFKQMDLITSSYPLGLIFLKIACFCDGCCGGFECDWGLMNYHYDSGPKKEFPTQLVEAGLALLIFVFLLWYRKRAKEGTMFPVYTIIYSATRFFSEFTSNKPDILWHLKTYHILCIIGIILGIAELILVLKYSEKIKLFFERSAFTLLKKKQSSTTKKKYPVQKKKK